MTRNMDLYNIWVTEVPSQRRNVAVPRCDLCGESLVRLGDGMPMAAEIVAESGEHLIVCMECGNDNKERLA